MAHILSTGDCVCFCTRQVPSSHGWVETVLYFREKLLHFDVAAKIIVNSNCLPALAAPAMMKVKIMVSTGELKQVTIEI